MRLLDTVLLAGGPGSGCNPAAGRCGRLPGDKGRGWTKKQKERLLKKYSTKMPKEVPGVVREKGKVHIANQPAPRRAIKQTWLAKEGHVVTLIKSPKAKGEVSVRRKPVSKYAGQFHREYEIQGYEKTRLAGVYSALGSKEGSGQTVIIHRDLGQKKVVVQEFTKGQYGHIEKEMDFSFKNFGKAAGFVKHRYGISQSLPRGVQQ